MRVRRGERVKECERGAAVGVCVRGREGGRQGQVCICTRERECVKECGWEADTGVCGKE